MARFGDDFENRKPHQLGLFFGGGTDAFASGGTGKRFEEEYGTSGQGMRGNLADKKIKFYMDQGLSYEEAAKKLDDGDKYRLDQPGDLAYQNAYDPASMTLNLDYDQRGLNQFRDEALKTGASAWSNRMMDQNQLQNINARESAGRQVAGQNAMAMSSLASHGGLSSGARERVARDGAKNQLLMSQDIGRQGRMNAMQIGINDEQNRMSRLSMLPGMEAQRTGMLADRDKFNINAKLEEAKRKNDFELGKYKEQMAAYSSGQTAAAQAEEGK